MPGFETIGKEEQKAVAEIFEKGGVLYRYGLDAKRQGIYRVDDFEKKIGEKVAKLSIDMLITVGPGGKIIARSSKEEGMAEERIFSFKRNEKMNLSKRLLSLTKSGDFILLKGSREMKMEEILEFWQKEYQKNNPT